LEKLAVYIIIIIAVVIAGISIYYFMTSEEVVKGEFYEKCITENEDCTYSNLISFIETTPDSTLKSKEVSYVLSSRAKDVKEKYEGVVLKEEDFSKNPDIVYIIRVVGLLDDEDKDYWFGRILILNKESWISTHLQIFYVGQAWKYDTLSNLLSFRREYLGLNKMNDGYVNRLIQNEINPVTVCESPFETNVAGVSQEFVKQCGLIKLSKIYICDVVPTEEDLEKGQTDVSEICNIFDYIKVKYFCDILNEDDQKLIDDTLLKEYETDPEGCKDNLIELNEIITQS